LDQRFSVGAKIAVYDDVFYIIGEQQAGHQGAGYAVKKKLLRRYEHSRHAYAYGQGITMAAGAMLSFIIIIVFVFLQKHIVEGIASTGIKG
jgi:hypothetical protein